MVMDQLDKTHRSVLLELRERLTECKRILSYLPPAFFLGAGLQFVSLIARQVLLEDLTNKKKEKRQGNQLNWFYELEDMGWLFKHQSDVVSLENYCQCVETLQHKRVPIERILHDCNYLDPETQIGPAFLMSEGVKRVLQWFQQ